jgi:hypothetical protein
LIKTTKKKSTYPKNKVDPMYNDIDTHMERDRKWKNIMIALDDMP